MRRLEEENEGRCLEVGGGRESREILGERVGRSRQVLRSSILFVKGLDVEEKLSEEVFGWEKGRGREGSLGGCVSCFSVVVISSGLGSEVLWEGRAVLVTEGADIVDESAPCTTLRAPPTDTATWYVQAEEFVRTVGDEREKANDMLFDVVRSVWPHAAIFIGLLRFVVFF